MGDEGILILGFLIVLLLIFPIPVIVLTLTYLIVFKFMEEKKKKMSLVFLVLLISYGLFDFKFKFRIGLVIKEHFKILKEYYKTSNNDLIFPYLQQSSQLKYWIFSLLIISLFFLLYFGLIYKEKEIPRDLPKLEYDFNINNNDHVMGNGTTRSGKTSALVKLIKQAFEEDRFVIAVDGKGDKQDYSLWEIVKDLAKNYNRKVYILDGSDTNCSDAYNPFLFATPTQIKDMLLNMSPFSQNYYEGHAKSYWQNMTYLLSLDEEFKSNITIQQLVKLSDNENFEKYVNDLFSLGVIDKSMVNGTMQVIKNSGEIVMQAIPRFATVIEGDGKPIFRVNKPFNIRKAYEENAVVLVLFNKLAYGDFTDMLSSLVVDDIRNNVAYWQRDPKFDTKKKPLIFLDELSVYMNDRLVDVINKGANVCQVVLSTQSPSDFDSIDGGVAMRQQFFENCNNYIFFRNNESKNAEYLSSLFGTRQVYDYTDKVELGMDSGVGTKRMVSEYIIHPDIIKSLPKLHGVQIDKNTMKVRYFKVKYIDRYPSKEYLKSHGMDTNSRFNDKLLKFINKRKDRLKWLIRYKF